MREIKFRAWSPQHEKMFRIENICFDGAPTVVLQYGPRIRTRLDNVFMMQFTGLLDKNGKEIYEGDIVRFTSDEYYSNDSFTMEPLDFTGRVMYDNALWIAGDDSDNSWLPLCDYSNEDLTCEVIGNIHESNLNEPEGE